MNIIEAIALGLIQGLTEFLPVSSSGHLVIFQNFFGFSHSLVAFDVMLHLGTLSAVVVFFWKDILKLSKQDLFGLLIGTVPAVIVGLLLSSVIDQAFVSTLLVGATLIFTGVFNLWSDKMLHDEDRPSTKQVAPKVAFKIGLWQALAIIPGISRSGSTVFGGLKLGLERQTAFKFSFLLSIPAIIGASVLQAVNGYRSGGLQLDILPTLSGMLVAFGVGLLCLKLLQYLINEAKLKYFAWYCFAVGGLVIASNFLV